MHKAVFLDRDGTIIKEKHYISDPDAVELLPGAALAIKLLREGGFKIIVITNQSGVGRGLFSLDTLQEVNQRFFDLLQEAGVEIDKLYYCPHKPEDNCNCRKPKLGMLEQAKKDFAINVNESYMIGDSVEDIEFGRRGGLFTILVLTGFGNETKGKVQPPDYIANDLLAAAKWICRRKIKNQNAKFKIC